MIETSTTTPPTVTTFTDTESGFSATLTGDSLWLGFDPASLSVEDLPALTAFLTDLYVELHGAEGAS